METIRLLVRNLAFLVMLAMFLDMLLPLQGTRRFIQVIIGLFVLLAVLSPIVSLFRQQPPLHFDMPAAATGGADLNTILKQGQDIQQLTSDQEEAAYVRSLQDQIEVVCRLVPGVKTARATVALSGSGAMTSMGAVQKVEVELQADGGQATRPVEDVRIGNERVENAPEAAPAVPETLAMPVDRTEIADQVRDTVASLFGLQKEQVTVNYVNQR